MLSKSYRMKKNSQFNYVFKKGTSLKHNKLLMFYSKTTSNKPKIGIVVSKKIGKSVTRNHTKRLIRESIRLNIDKFNKKFNYVFVARAGIEKLNSTEITENILNLLEKQ